MLRLTVFSSIDCNFLVGWRLTNSSLQPQGLVGFPLCNHNNDLYTRSAHFVLGMVLTILDVLRIQLQNMQRANDSEWASGGMTQLILEPMRPASHE